jgi:hypothetical protein
MVGAIFLFVQLGCILLGMFSNEFWRGFLMGGGLVFLVFYVTVLITRNRKKGSRF